MADTTTGALTIDADAGLIVGGSQELTVTVSSNDVTIAQTSEDKDLKFTVNDGGVTQQNLFQLSASSYEGSSDEAMLFVSANANNALDLNARVWHIDGGQNANGTLLSIDATHKLRNSAVKIKGSNTSLDL